MNPTENRLIQKKKIFILSLKKNDTMHDSIDRIKKKKDH